MAFVYARNRARACLQCRNSNEEGNCTLESFFSIEIVKRNKGTHIHTYDCRGFEHKEIETKFSTYPHM